MRLLISVLLALLPLAAETSDEKRRSRQPRKHSMEWGRTGVEDAVEHHLSLLTNSIDLR
jgi:hypothetical protein